MLGDVTAVTSVTDVCVCMCGYSISQADDHSQA